MERVVAALRGGADRVIIREDQLPDELLDLDPGWLAAVSLHLRLPAADALAASLGMGLHLPGGADPAAWRARFPGHLSWSAHSAAEARAALTLGVEDVLLAPVFPPGSKADDRRPPLGLEALAAAPGVLALGGVHAGNAAACMAAGAAGVAVLGALFEPSLAVAEVELRALALRAALGAG